MKNTIITFFLLLVMSLCGTTVFAQNKKSAADVVQDLKLELIDINAQEEILKLRVQQLDESLKPENIENSLAGIGSTRPEELRAQRQRQLTIEKTATVAKLEQLTTRRAQLEAALATAESQAYQESANNPGIIENALALTPNRWLTILAGGLLTLGVLVAILILLRYARSERAMR